MPDAAAAKKAEAYLETCIQDQNSSGGVVECMISGVGLNDALKTISLPSLIPPRIPPA